MNTEVEMAIRLLVMSVFIVSGGSAQALATNVVITIQPGTPLIEHLPNAQNLQSDFAVHNVSGHTLRVGAINAEVFNKSNRLALSKTMNSNGLRPGIEIIESAPLRPGEPSMRSIRSSRLLAMCRCPD